MSKPKRGKQSCSEFCFPHVVTGMQLHETVLDPQNKKRYKMVIFLDPWGILMTTYHSQFLGILWNHYELWKKKTRPLSVQELESRALFEEAVICHQANVSDAQVIMLIISMKQCKSHHEITRYSVVSGLTEGAFLKPFTAWNIPPPMAPMVNAPPQSSTILQGLKTFRNNSISMYRKTLLIPPGCQIFSNNSNDLITINVSILKSFFDMD